MTESTQDPAVRRQEARQRYIEAIKDFHQSLLVVAEKNEAVIAAFNEYCMAGGSIIAVHWTDLDSNPLNNGSIIFWTKSAVCGPIFWAQLMILEGVHSR